MVRPRGPQENARWLRALGAPEPRASCPRPGLLTAVAVQVISNSLRPHGQQHARPPCPSPSPGVCSNSCLLSQRCHPTISSSVAPFSSRLQSFFFFFPPSILPRIRVFSNELALCIGWPKYWSFSFITPSNEHSGLISFRIDWLELLAVQGMLKSLLQHHSSKASVLRELANTGHFVPEQTHGRPHQPLGIWRAGWPGRTDWDSPGISMAPGTLCAWGLELASAGTALSFIRVELACGALPPVEPLTSQAAPTPPPNLTSRG